MFPWRASQVATERQRSWRMWTAKIHLTAAWQGRDECGTPWRVDMGGLFTRCLQGMMPLRQNRHAYERACALFAGHRHRLDSSKARDRTCHVTHEKTGRNLESISRVETEKYDQADTRE